MAEGKDKSFAVAGLVIAALALLVAAADLSVNARMLYLMEHPRTASTPGATGGIAMHPLTGRIVFDACISIAALVGIILSGIAWFRSRKARSDLAELENTKSRLEESAARNLQYRLQIDELTQLEKRCRVELERAQELLRQCEEERRAAMKNAEEANAQLAVFAPPQLEAFQLSKDLLALIAEMGKRPWPDKESYPQKDAKGLEEFLQAKDALSRPWELTFQSRLRSRFSQRIDDIVCKFAEAGLDRNWFVRYKDGAALGIFSNRDVFVLAHGIATSAYGLDTMKVVPILDDPETK